MHINPFPTGASPWQVKSSGVRQSKILKSAVAGCTVENSYAKRVHLSDDGSVTSATLKVDVAFVFAGQQINYK